MVGSIPISAYYGLIQLLLGLLLPLKFWKIINKLASIFILCLSTIFIFSPLPTAAERISFAAGMVDLPDSVGIADLTLLEVQII